jgi:hypothetical protein
MADVEVTVVAGIIEVPLPGESSVAAAARASAAEAAAATAAALSSRTIATQHSLTGGGTLAADRTLALVNDAATPGASKLYGTDAGGERGWFDRNLFNPVGLADGSAAAPAIAFTAESGAGFYRIGTGVVGISARGLLALSIAAPASAVNYPELTASAAGVPVRLLAAGSDANIGLVLSPKGSGALMAHLPDNAATGGNARGANATDMQTVRSVATQVASGAFSTIAGGRNNLVNGQDATVGGGGTNSASNDRATVAGGSGNTASGANATIGGGNSNTASGSAASVAGGLTNIASGINATVAGGASNTANGTRAWVPGGGNATTRGIAGRGAWAGLQIAAQGDAQCGEHPLLRQTTDATATRLTSDNAALGAANQIILPNFGRYAGLLEVTAGAQGSLNSASWFIQVAARRGANAAATVVYGGGGTAIAPTFSEGAGSAWRLDITADTTNGGIAVTVTGAVATTIIWSARFANVEAVPAS